MSKFNNKRIPENDEILEKNRKEEYWNYLILNIKNIKDKSKILAKYEKFTFNKLNTADDADYEAAFMQHSIGHSWDKYSKFGNIYSIRDNENIPLVTVLVSDNYAIHYREENNARLSIQNKNLLQQFANMLGFKIKEEDNIDIFSNENSQNIKIIYLLRSTDNVKQFKEITLNGSFSNEQTSNLKFYFNNFPDEANIVSSQLLEIDSEDKKFEISCITDDNFIENDTNNSKFNTQEFYSKFIEKINYKENKYSI